MKRCKFAVFEHIGKLNSSKIEGANAETFCTSRCPDVLLEHLKTQFSYDFSHVK